MITLNPSGEQLKREALTLLEENREAIIVKARRLFLKHLLIEGTGTTDDARRGLELPAHVNPVCLGAVPRVLALLGIIRCIGYQKSTRPEAHARTIKVWALVDPVKARAWLDAHPEPSPPANVQTELTLTENETPGRANAPANN